MCRSAAGAAELHLCCLAAASNPSRCCRSVAEASQLVALLLLLLGVSRCVRANPGTAADDSSASDLGVPGFAGLSGFPAFPGNGGLVGTLVNSVNGGGPREAVEGAYAADARAAGRRSVWAVRSDHGRFSLGGPHLGTARTDTERPSSRPICGSCALPRSPASSRHGFLPGLLDSTPGNGARSSSRSSTTTDPRRWGCHCLESQSSAGSDSRAGGNGRISIGILRVVELLDLDPPVDLRLYAGLPTAAPVDEIRPESGPGPLPWSP